jgi:hypothetical protein
MILSKNVECSSCGHKYRLRYGMGNSFPQHASFFCKQCGSQITFGFDADRAYKTENCAIVEEKYDDDVINLHPELTIDEDRQSDPHYFPTLDFMNNFSKKKSLREFRSAQFSNIAYVKRWDALAEDFRLLTEQRWPMLEKKYGDQAKAKNEIITEALSIAKIFLEGEWTNLLESALVNVESVRHHANFNELKTFLSEYHEDFLEFRLYQLMDQYSTVESELLATLLLQKSGDRPKGITSSVKWEKMERVYGDFYEIYGELAIIPTVVNSVLARGDYKLFNTPGFTIDKYIASDKAGRCENFKANPNLAKLADFYDNNLRNGTHHKTARINKGKQKIVLRTGKGGNNEKVFSFAEYIEHCNELYAHSLIVLLMMDRLLK